MSKGVITRSVLIGGRTWEKPWDPSCGACRSPWLLDIDAALAEGYTLRQIARILAGRHPAVPNEIILRGHVQHLAPPHLKARIAFEESAKARGDDPDSSPATAEDALEAIIRQGREVLAQGELAVSAKDMIAAMRLKQQMAAREGEGVEVSAWQGAFMEFFEIVRKHLGHAQWKAFVNDVYASPAIRAVLSDKAPALPGGDT